MAVTIGVTESFDNSGEVGSTTRDELVNYNKLVADVAAIIDFVNALDPAPDPLLALTAEQIGGMNGAEITE